MKEGNRFKMILAVIAIVAITLFILSFPAKKSWNKFLQNYLNTHIATIQQDYENKIKEKDTEIGKKTEQAIYWENRYRKIRTQIETKAKEAENIKKPEGKDEISNCLNKHNYHPTVRE